MDAKQTPLTELLEAVPANARVITSEGEFHSRNHPVGRLCHEAAQRLRELEARTDHWHQAVLAQCMAVESCYREGDPKGTLEALINWHVQNALHPPVQQKGVTE